MTVMEKILRAFCMFYVELQLTTFLPEDSMDMVGGG